MRVEHRKVTVVGTSLGITLPKEILEKLGVGHGDYIAVVFSEPPALAHSDRVGEAIQRLQQSSAEEQDGWRGQGESEGPPKVEKGSP